MKNKLLQALAFLAFAGLASFLGFHSLNKSSRHSYHRHRIFQGDILLREEKDGGPLLWQEAGRAATTLTKGLKWPGGVVPYLFTGAEEDFTEEERQVIRSAMDALELNCCVFFVESQGREESFLAITGSSPGGCAAELGFQGGLHELSLESPYCLGTGTILHELMHVLGFVHEHSRPDRDDHIEVAWENIAEKNVINFERLAPQSVDYGSSYDIESIMHYSAHEFALDDSQPTLRPIDETIPLENLGKGRRMGHLTAKDVRKLNSYYGCEPSSESAASQAEEEE